MRTPWFMHTHAGRNTLVGVHHSVHGTYVRSYGPRSEESHAVSTVEVWFYPAHGSRDTTKLASVYSGRDDLEAFVDAVVERHAARMDKTEAAPVEQIDMPDDPGVYYSVSADNFYDHETKRGKGIDYWQTNKAEAKRLLDLAVIG